MYPGTHYANGKRKRHMKFRKGRFIRYKKKFRRRFTKRRFNLRNGNTNITPPILCRSNFQYYQPNKGYGVDPSWIMLDLGVSPKSYGQLPYTVAKAMATHVVANTDFIGDTDLNAAEYYNFANVKTHYTLNFPDNFDVNCQLYVLKVTRNAPENYLFQDIMTSSANLGDVDEYTKDHGTQLWQPLTTTDYKNAGVINELFMDRWKRTREFHKYLKIIRVKKFTVPAAFNSDLNFSISRKRMFINSSAMTELTGNPESDWSSLTRGDIFPILVCRGQLSHTEPAGTTEAPIPGYVGWPKPVVVWHVSNTATYWPRTTTTAKKIIALNQGEVAPVTEGVLPTLKVNTFQQEEANVKFE